MSKLLLKQVVIGSCGRISYNHRPLIVQIKSMRIAFDVVKPTKTFDSDIVLRFLLPFDTESLNKWREVDKLCQKRATYLFGGHYHGAVVDNSRHFPPHIRLILPRGVKVFDDAGTEVKIRALRRDRQVDALIHIAAISNIDHGAALVLRAHQIRIRTILVIPQGHSFLRDTKDASTQTISVESDTQNAPLKKKILDKYDRMLAMGVPRQAGEQRKQMDLLLKNKGCKGIKQVRLKKIAPPPSEKERKRAAIIRMRDRDTKQLAPSLDVIKAMILRLRRTRIKRD